MNTITLDSNSNIKNIVIKEDTNIVYNSCNSDFFIKVVNNSKVFEYYVNCNVNNTYDLSSSFVLNRFSINSSLKTIINLNNENIVLDYYYSTINEDDNKYVIDVNHNSSNTTSKVVNHGINMTDSKLDFIVNGVVKKESVNSICNQDSKILVMGENNSSIKPNLIIDNNDIIANHSAYVGYFKKDVLFYLNSRGIDSLSAEKLLAKSFLIGNMDISFMQRDIIIQNIDKYWR